MRNLLVAPIKRYGDVVRERAASEFAQPDRGNEMLRDTKRICHAPRRVKLKPMTLAVINRKCEQPKAFCPRDSRGRGRVEATGKQYDRVAIGCVRGTHHYACGCVLNAHLNPRSAILARPYRP